MCYSITRVIEILRNIKVYKSIRVLKKLLSITHLMLNYEENIMLNSYKTMLNVICVCVREILFFVLYFLHNFHSHECTINNTSTNPKFDKIVIFKFKLPWFIFWLIENIFGINHIERFRSTCFEPTFVVHHQDKMKNQIITAC